ncbi:hypothetical protein HY496_00795 [Candidatus Woesearchaeota archaeon]|nr:hypothetical protein [Candidatus Woesearchaeota archaeon]
MALETKLVDTTILQDEELDCLSQYHIQTLEALYGRLAAPKGLDGVQNALGATRERVEEIYTAIQKEYAAKYGPRTPREPRGTGALKP